MSHVTIRNTQQPDVVFELKAFIGGVTQTTKCNQFELTKAALLLLKTLPAARDAVLGYFCAVFDNATQNYVVRIETEISTGKLPPPTEDDEAVVSEIHTVVCGLISSNPEAWAPIISTWCLERLGELSTKYAGRAHVSSSVNETLQLWMNCRATRTLIDITTQCLSSLIHADTEACINALLDTSVKHSPNFDWVVAHVGSCFPNTVITRVLSCGLKDFCQNKSYEQGCDSPKLKSVVGILGHLAGSHCDDICKALSDLFQWSLQLPSSQDPEDTKPQKKATVPFLLQLAFLSPTLLLALCKDIRKTLTTDVIVLLYNFMGDWCKYFGSAESLQAFIINLIIKCEVGGEQIIKVFLDCIFMQKCENESIRQDIKHCAGEMLESVLQEVDLLIRARTQQPNTPINILDSFMREVETINEILLSPERIKAQTAARIIMFIGHTNPSILVKSCGFLFKKAENDENLAFLLQILTSELLDKTREPYPEKGGHFAVVLEQILNKLIKSDSKTEECTVQMWRNLLTLLEWEKSNQVFLMRSKLISRAIFANLTSLTKLFGSNGLDSKVYHILAELLETLEVPSEGNHLSYSIAIETMLTFTSSTANYFFMCCREEEYLTKLVGFKRTFVILRRLTQHFKPAHTLALRELLERALFTNDKYLFGASGQSVLVDTSEKLLLSQNRKNNKTIPLTKNSSVLNGGIIGSGKKKTVEAKSLPEHKIAENTTQFIKAIRSCCELPPKEEKKNNTLDIDALTSVSLLLVQLVSPDVMYNGLPWPEEEFCKVTIERDFYIRRLFNNTPLLWELLSFIAMYRPTLCYCSVLLRAITATLIHQWNSSGDQSKAANSEKFEPILNTTVKVLDVMALGQLLPPPLSSIRDAISYLKCSEIVQILRDCVWNYMRDHVPSPALFTTDEHGIRWRDPSLSRPPDIYTTTLRMIMQQNIRSVGHLYGNMFINFPHNE